MKLSNTDQHYGTVAIALHWLIASLIVALVAMGIYMVRLPDVGFNGTKIAAGYSAPYMAPSASAPAHA